jgi:hypothetical protein
MTEGMAMAKWGYAHESTTLFLVHDLRSRRFGD